MKEIFDWLREQIYGNNDKAKNFSKDTYVVNKEYADKIINEAEAKWESDCCEYEYHVAPSKDIYFLTRCNHRHNGRLSGDRPYCGFCGKRIKIAEVE